MKTLITLLALAVLALLWLRHENANLTRSFEQANKVATEQKNVIGMLKNQLSVSQGIARKNETAQVSLRGELLAAGAMAVRREETITRLINENETLRRWYRGNQSADGSGRRCGGGRGDPDTKILGTHQCFLLGLGGGA
ncbi:LysB family phage lysis regulatory protein [Enterobacter wuhouensis]|uniref:LysB family phage lysis regulatory protein n=1 Tax=Enterobacter wuhouensis TaxID=2529381 RepID=UPI0021E56CA0|nr:LysB family phage lysis regulatory protein [Enterobacter wuhouensis]MCV2535109.1 LysB family phage lysis regulatory protein [Enterobacter wuhouensis]